MSFQEQHIREILDTRAYAVDPGHEAAFRAMLLREKRRRRFLVLFLFSAVIGAAAFLWGPGIFSATPTTGQEQKILIDTQADDNLKESRTPATSHSDAGLPDSESSELQDPTTDEVRNQGSGSSASQPVSSPRDEAPSNVLPSISSSSTSQTSAFENISTPVFLPTEAPEVDQPEISNPFNRNTALSETGGPADGSDQTIAQSPADEQDHAITSSTSESTVDPKNTVDPDQDPVSEMAADEMAEIIPVAASRPWEKWTLGTTAMWYPTGLTAGDAVSIGNGFQIGGFGTYQFAPQFYVRSDIGFGFIDGGFLYSKESVSEVFAFSALTLHNSLQADRLYSAYLSADFNWESGKYNLFGGAEFQYLYGARGDIHREEYPRDSPAPVPLTAQNVWVSLADVQQWTLRAQLGFRYQVIPRLQVGAALRIPLMRELRLSHSAGDYQYRFVSPGIAPALSLSYQLIQQ